jgi:hypothetical protein
MMPVFNSFQAAFTDFIIQNVLGEEVGSCAEAILEI